LNLSIIRTGPGGRGDVFLSRDDIARFKEVGLKETDRREFIGVTFTCCNVYTRIYLNKKKTAFIGWCPKCGASMEVLISPTGSKSRFFQTR
jgi:hypothetical protein